MPFQNGGIPWNKGKSQSVEHRAKISAGLTGKTLSAKTRKRLSRTARERLRTGPIDRRRCEICRGQQYRGWSIARDHDHETGAARGFLCNGCNRALGRLERFLRERHATALGTETWLRAALIYLQRHGSRWRLQVVK